MTRRATFSDRVAGHFDRALMLELGQLPTSTGGSSRIALDWFADQADEVGAAVRLEIARRERMESES